MLVNTKVATAHREGTAATAAAVTLTLGIAAASWVVAVRQMNGMDMGVATQLGSFAFFAVLWVAMMAAMMLPGAAPAVSRRTRAVGAQPGYQRQTRFVTERRKHRRRARNLAQARAMPRHIARCSRAAQPIPRHSCGTLRHAAPAGCGRSLTRPR